MSDSQTANSAKKFNAFGGVFTPNVLTILGVILFLRAGWVVGSVGLGGAVLIILLAHLISVSTGLSLSSIATNMDVKAGGNYYMISRTLGIEIGGSIGIPLYMSQALSISFYSVGFAEGLRWLYPQANITLTAFILCFILTVISYLGTDWAIKVQYIILAVLAMSLVSFFTGGSQFTGTVATHSMTWFRISDVGFWTVFAVFFPAVTGFGVGVSMSGDLKDPQKSIPIGTMAAIGVTFLIYLAQAFWLAWHVPTDQLLNNMMIVRDISRWTWLILAGLWLASLSSALGSVMSAPRTMQALAVDGILPKFLAKGDGDSNEPRMATLITFFIAEWFVLMGGLDALAPVITMFFLNTYGVTNLIAALESFSGNPSYRPKLKVSWWISFVGAVSCYLAMFLIHAPATIAAIAITILIFLYLSKKELHANWSDVRYGLWYSLGRFIIFKLEEIEKKPINWRPNLMVFSGNPSTRKGLIELANWLGRRRGIVTVYNIIVGDEEKLLRHRKPAKEALESFIRNNGFQALGQVHLSSSFRAGAKEVAQAHGLGEFRSNIVLMGWSQDETRSCEFVKLVRELHQLDKSVLLLKLDEAKGFGNFKRIDVWWSDVQNDNHLMIIMAHIISNDVEWEDAEINLNVVIEDEHGRPHAQENIEAIIKKANLKAKVNIYSEETSSYKMPYMVQQYSKEADLVMMKMDLPEEGGEEEFVKSRNLLLTNLPTTLFVKNTEEVELVSG
ncbi:MAG: Na-K-Cl cotransporter [Nitrospinota bacterium]